MSLLELLILLVLSGLVGTIAEYLMGFSFGDVLLSVIIGSVIIGVLGAYIGGWVTSRLGVPRLLPITVGTTTIDLVWATVGSLVLVALLSMLRGRRTVRSA